MKRSIPVLVAAALLALAACESSKGSDTGSVTTDNGSPTDPGTTPTDPGTKTDNPTVDPGVPDVPTTCDTVPPTPKTMGQDCETDCDCEAGLVCYAEAYPGAKGICTRDCAGDCGDDKMKCLNLTALKKTYGLTLGYICIPVCSSIDDCKHYSEAYTVCPTSSTSWEGHTVAGVPTCMVQEAP